MVAPSSRCLRTLAGSTLPVDVIRWNTASSSAPASTFPFATASSLHQLLPACISDCECPFFALTPEFDCYFTQLLIHANHCGIDK